MVALGGPDNPTVDILLMLYAEDGVTLQRFAEAQIDHLVRHGLRIISGSTVSRYRVEKNILVFAKALASPISKVFVETLFRVTAWRPENFCSVTQRVWAVPNRPTLAAADDSGRLLPPAPDHPMRRDLGMNGSYLVFRQLQRRPSAFWNYCAEKAPAVFPGDNAGASVALASKMVGRWPNGAPLVKAPLADSPQVSDDNDFLYVRSGDADGLRCPIGSHVRRSNPRDSLDPSPAPTARRKMNNRHRIIRRGGPTVPRCDVDGSTYMIGTPDDGQERGLHFDLLQHADRPSVRVHPTDLAE